MAENFMAFVDGIPMFFIGMIVVFAMLFLLIGFMLLMGKIISSLVDGKARKNEQVDKEALEASSKVVATTEENKVDDLELVAVITAAIAATLGTSSDTLQVKSIRKVQRKARI